MIRNYFNLYSKKIENKLRKSNLKKRFRRLSSNKIYINNNTYKHTNDKITITIHIYNKQIINYKFFIERKFKRFFSKFLNSKLYSLKHKVNKILDKNIKNKLILLSILNKSNKNINKGVNLHIYINKIRIYKKIINIIMKRYRRYFLYKQLLYINKSKLNYNYLTYLNSIIKKIFNKKVQYNIVNLKYFYLDSDIFSNSIILKIRRNRRNIARKLKFLIIKSKVSKVSKFITYKPIYKNRFKEDELKVEKALLLENLYRNRKTLKKTVLNLIKYKKITGVRLEAKGRLTRRYTASRSVSKLRYKGNLTNIDSSFLGISSVLLRNNLKSNVQYTKSRSKTRIGSFGIKG